MFLNWNILVYEIHFQSADILINDTNNFEPNALENSQLRLNFNYIYVEKRWTKCTKSSDELLLLLLLLSVPSPAK